MNKVIADFTANGLRFQVIARNNGEDGYAVFARGLSNLDSLDVDFYNKKEPAIARFLFLTNRLLLEV